jgi:hypothetical protein
MVVRRTGWLWIAAGLTLAALAGCGPQTAGTGQAAGSSATTGPAAGPSDTGSTPSGTGQTGSTPTSPAPTRATAPKPAATTPTGPDRCHTADLRAALHQLDSAAGQRYAALVLTNRSTRACRVYGYGGVQLLDAARRPVPTMQVRDPLAPPRLVLLRPGASAYSRLHWTVVLSTGDNQTGPCQPNPSYLLVTPPDETQPITVPWTSGSVCQRGRIDQTAYAPGTGPA